MKIVKQIEFRKLLFFILLLLPIVAVFGMITYAFFQSVGDVEEEKISIRNGNLALSFKDNDSTVENLEGTWTLGETIEKELIIENRGTEAASAKILWNDLMNTYMERSLTYQIDVKTEGDNFTWTKVNTDTVYVPKRDTPSKEILADHLEIPAGTTYIYKLSITLKISKI